MARNEGSKKGIFSKLTDKLFKDGEKAEKPPYPPPGEKPETGAWPPPYPPPGEKPENGAWPPPYPPPGEKPENGAWPPPYPPPGEKPETGAWPPPYPPPGEKPETGAWPPPYPPPGEKPETGAWPPPYPPPGEKPEDPDDDPDGPPRGGGTPPGPGPSKPRFGPPPNGQMRGGGPPDKPQNKSRAIKRLLFYLKPDRLKLISALFCIAAGSVSGLICTYMLNPIIRTLGEVMKTPQTRIAELMGYVLILGAFYAMSVLAAFIHGRLMAAVSQRTAARIRTALFEKIQLLKMEYFDKSSAGDIISRFTNDIENLAQMLNSVLSQLLSGIITLIGSVALMFYMSVPLTVITLITTPLMAAVGAFAAGRLHSRFAAQQAAMGELNGYIEEIVSGQRTVKIHGYESGAKKEFVRLNRKFYTAQCRASFTAGVMEPAMNALAQISYTLTAFIGAMLVLLTKTAAVGPAFAALDIGRLTVFISSSKQFSRPINEMAEQLNNIMSALASAERVFDIMELPPEDTGGETELKHARGEIKFEGVSFGYTPHSAVLRDISFSANPGQKIAVVGKTGAGKTTLAKLILRFYDADSGRITMDGVDIRDISIESLRGSVAIVLQESMLFSGTIMENIRYGRPDASDDEVTAAAKTARAHSFIKNMREGYDTILTGAGARLSAGQRQLLCIARAALSDAPVLILDEATSFVDTKTESEINEGMASLMEGRTTFIIAHRLSTILNSDRIIEIDEGGITEISHSDFLDKRQPGIN